MTTPMEFKLMRFNPRRALRGAPAAELECTGDGPPFLLWMSKQDIANNIRDFGQHPELLKARQHYRTKVEFDAMDDK